MATIYRYSNNDICEVTPVFYGDVAFSTFRAFGTVIPWWDHHLERLKRGAYFLARDHNWDSLLINLQDGQRQFAKYFQGREWMGRPTIRRVEANLQLDFYAWEAQVLSHTPQKLALALEERTRTLPTDVKGGNYKIETLGREWAITQGMDDVLFWHGPQKFVSETSTSNIFFLNAQRELHTPAIVEGSCLGGIVREQVVTMAKKLGLQIFERPIALMELEKMTEAFLTNCGQLIRPVERIGNYFFSSSNSLTNELVKELKLHITNLK